MELKLKTQISFFKVSFCKIFRKICILWCCLLPCINFMNFFTILISLFKELISLIKCIIENCKFDSHYPCAWKLIDVFLRFFKFIKASPWDCKKTYQRLPSILEEKIYFQRGFYTRLQPSYIYPLRYIWIKCLFLFPLGLTIA